MDSFEIVNRTLEFECPERIAHTFFPSDLVWGGVHADAPLDDWHRVSEREWQRVDQWGNLWSKSSNYSRGKIIKGGLQDLSHVKDFPFPDYGHPSRFLPIRKAFALTPDKWHIGMLTGSTFEIASSLLDHYTLALFDDPLSLKTLHDHIDSLLKKEVEGFKDAGAQGIMIIEDLAETLQVPMGPSIWKEEFKPRLQSLCSFAHKLGLKMIMHSVQEASMVSELIDSGVDCIQLDCPRALGIDSMELLRDRYHVTFWCPVDISTTLKMRNEDIIRAEARELVEKLWKGEGGFIAGYYWDNISLGLDPEYQEYAVDEFKKWGRRDQLHSSSRHSD
ncbi:MAG: hypothetical protein GX089_13665 [Fibrobacter sp.]|jgi:uroporphyrinogen decarboxylase|nr:hypothetical protein [Fibrobacter sp.]